jgi:hypothetical protein
VNKLIELLVIIVGSFLLSIGIALTLEFISAKRKAKKKGRWGNERL